MMTSVDGKITGPYMETGAADIVGREYERTNDLFHPDAWLCGRVTTDEAFTLYRTPGLDENAPEVPAGDFVSVNDAKMYYISADPSGKLGWTSNTLHYADRAAAHVVEILTERASNPYKAFLRRLGISYIIAGKEHLDCTLASQKLRELFGIETLMLSGGGYINGSFLNEGLIDQLSLVITPVTDSLSDTVTLFEKADYLPEKAPVEFSLQSVEKLAGDGIWLRYLVKNK